MASTIGPLLRWVEARSAPSRKAKRRRAFRGAAIFATDELPTYFAIGRRHAGHIRVNPAKWHSYLRGSAGEYARTDARTSLRAHVNVAERRKWLRHFAGVHALFKRALVGVFHSVSGKHMGRYLGEARRVCVGETGFRWNNRRPFEGRLTALFSTKATPVPLQGLFA